MPGAVRFVLPFSVLLVGLGLNLLDPLACLAALVFILWVILDKRLPALIWLCGTLLGGLLLAAHLLPGFTAHALTSPENLGGVQPWQLRLSVDKALVAATLLAWWLGQSHQPWRSWQRSALVAGTSLLLIPLLAVSCGVLGWLPKWPEHFWLWLTLNVLVTCLAEELIFRALLQRALVQRLGAPAGIIVTALLFGAAHLPFSPAFAMIATLAGLGYGLVFHLSGERLWPAVALHGAVNSTHILLLTYPI